MEPSYVPLYGVARHLRIAQEHGSLVSTTLVWHAPALNVLENPERVAALKIFLPHALYVECTGQAAQALLTVVALQHPGLLIDRRAWCR